MPYVAMPSRYPAARLVSRIFRLFVDPLNVLGQIQAAGKIEVHIGLDRNKVIGLFAPNTVPQRSSSAIHSIIGTRPIKDDRLLTMRGCILPSYARNFADVAAHCLEKP